MSIDRFMMPYGLAVGGCVGSRRRGSVLVLVMTVLGVLFVTGIAFLTTMEFESRMLQAERQRDRMRPGMQSVMDEMGDILVTVTSQDAQALVGGALFASIDSASVPLPGVHNLYSPVEPYYDGITDSYYYRWMTDVRWLSGESSVIPGTGGAPDKPRRAAPSSGQDINTEWESGAVLPRDVFEDTTKFPSEPMIPVDADGDGIVDSFQVELSDIVMESTRIAALSDAVNPTSVQAGPVYLGLRVLPHGGMANVNDSHPMILDTLGIDSTRLSPSYESQQEEPSLRRRGMLPPRDLPPTLLQGNPIVFDTECGNGDFCTTLFSPDETLWEHRYWPYEPKEFDDSIDGERPIWALRMEPASRWKYGGSDEYDRRHLITTISHDDLLARRTMDEAYDPTTPELRSFEVIKEVVASLGTAAVNAQFPIANYPAGTSDSRTGRLKLSLPWLQEQVDLGVPDGGISKAEEIKLIQDAFTLMLLNARGPEWGSIVEVDTTDNSIPDTWWFDRGTDGWANISRAAASLTANLIDFADADDDPTQVPLRDADPSTKHFGNPLASGDTVFGIERQPFITEVLVDSDFDPPPGGDGVIVTDIVVAVELFNPYDTPLELALGMYELGIAGAVYDIPLTTMQPQQFVVLFAGDKSALPSGFDNTELTSLVSGDLLGFNENASIRLLRPVIDNAGNSVRVVVDEFQLSGTNVGFLGDGPKSSERFVGSSFLGTHWLASIPETSTDSNEGLPPNGHGLGEFNPPLTSDLKPVEVELADSGTLESAFPTTGSLLLLMRHANSDDVPFTRHLKGERNVVQHECGLFGGPCDPVANPVKRESMIDNGRMPVFDIGRLHHVDPALVRYDAANPTLSPLSIDVSLSQADRGTADNLPWGQLVFDYFTALPLANDGPYSDPSSTDIQQPRVDQDGMRVHGRINMNAAPWSVLAGVPRRPLEDFPQPFQDRFRDALPMPGGLPPPVDEPLPIGEELARAIVAYRDAREGFDPVAKTPLTGNYKSSWRGWAEKLPQARRGMGFMTVGELANVRLANVAPSDPDYDDLYQADRGVVDLPNGGNYLDAVATLVTLGDWLTVRSHVFTVYGVLRGAEDDTIEDDDPAEQAKLRREDIDRRALRFQETIDRFPMLIDDPPQQIGSPVLAKYEDLLGD